MTKTMLIDAAHPEETRVAVISGDTIEDFDFETFAKRQLRGNIYLAKVTRVEPSLQAAFVEYGGNRHGFLAFSEIHPDYYQIPIEDREALLREQRSVQTGDDDDHPSEEDDDALSEGGRRNRRALRKYKIQEVIRRRQIMLVQVVKEERGTKGAALTTFISLAGRYCVLMPNTARGGGISRKIANSADRQRLKKVTVELEVPEGMGLIVRTAGAKRTKTELKRDYDYLLRLWDNIRETTMKSIAPALVFEEGSLVRRALRDLYDKDVEQVLVEGDDAYREAKEFVRMLMPSHAKKVQAFREREAIFTKFRLENQLETIFSPVVRLRSGGYLVINQTEALVAIDVNSGKSTGERSIESTAYRTNLEAADEAARQMRLRDLAGLVVIDFIDMEEAKNTRAVEKRMKDALRFDRARVQMGKISSFGLLEISRQRRRTGLMEGISNVCEHCQGSGRIRSPQSAALALLRALEDAAARGPAQIEAAAPLEVVLYLLNDKRDQLMQLEARAGVLVRVHADPQIHAGEHRIERLPLRHVDDESEEGFALAPMIQTEPGEDEIAPRRGGGRQDRHEDERRSEDRRERRRNDHAPRAAEANGSTQREEAESEERAPGTGRRRRNRRRRGGGGHDQTPRPDPLAVISFDDPDATEDLDEGEENAIAPANHAGAAGSEDEPRRRRRRGRRGGRRRRDETAIELGGDSDLPGIPLEELASASPLAAGELVAIAADDDESTMLAPPIVIGSAPGPLPEPPEPFAEAAPVSEESAPPAKPTRRRSTKAAAAAAVEAAPVVTDSADLADPIVAHAAEPLPVVEGVAPAAPAAEPVAAAADEAPEDPSLPKKKGWWAMRKSLFSGE